MLVMLGLSVVLMVLLSGLVMTEFSGKTIARQLAWQGQALNASRAGLNETLSWFVRRPVQPVTTFDPQKDLTAVPPLNETEDPTVGLVRSYEISDRGRVWGRYEVDKSVVADVSAQRGKSQPGTIWEVESKGIIYIRNDAAKAPDEAPNRVLAHATMRTDIQRLGLQLPADCALCAEKGQFVNVAATARVRGGTGIGIAYLPSTGTPKIAQASSVTGSPRLNATTGSFQLQDIFGVTQQELIGMADVVVKDERDLPDPLPDMSLVVITGNATFTPQRRLLGSGILVVLGNLVLNPQSNSMFNGVIWVGGTFQQGEPSLIGGSVVVRGNALLTGGSDISEIDYDPNMIDQVRQQMGNYLFSRMPWILGRIGD